MKLLSLLFFTLFSAVMCDSSLRASLNEEISTANASLTSGHPAEALAAYQTLLRSPELSTSSAPEIWFHRGLAEEQTGDPVAASLSFRRALLLDPALQPALQHLSSLLRTLGVPLPSGLHERILAFIHPDKLILGGAVLGWFGVFFAVFFFFSRERRPVWLAVALTACMLGHGICLFGSWIDPRRTAADAAVVTAKSAPTLRATPADSGAVAGTLPSGSLITVLSRNGAWWYVSGGSGLTGWIPATTLTPLLPASSGF